MVRIISIHEAIRTIVNCETKYTHVVRVEYSVTHVEQNALQTDTATGCCDRRDMQLNYRFIEAVSGYSYGDVEILRNRSQNF